MQGYWTSSRQPLEQLRKSGFICRQVGRPQRSQGAGEERRGHPCLFLPPNAMRSCGGICFLWIGSRNKKPLQGSTASLGAVQLSDPCPALEVGSLSISCTNPFPDVKWCLNLKLSSSSQSNCEILKNATLSFLPLFFFFVLWFKLLLKAQKCTENSVCHSKPRPAKSASNRNLVWYRDLSGLPG